MAPHPDISAPKMVKPEETLEDLGSVNPEEVIHVQKDALLGGNICAKIVFFCLLGAIGVMVGLIIVEYRGSKEVEIQPPSHSPWASMFQGWVDTTSDHTDEHELNEYTKQLEESESLKDEDSGEKKQGDDKEVEEKSSESSFKQRFDEEEDDEKNSDDIEEQKEAEGEQQATEEGEEEETSGVALKFGVGVALVVVAHVVLVRKWNSAGEDSASTVQSETVPTDETIPEPESAPENLSRRQTLVPPSALEEKPPSPVEEPEYSNDEEEEEEEESEKIKQTIEELKQTYSHLTPEGSDLEEDEYDIKPTSKNYTYTPTPPESEPEEQSDPEAEEDEEEEEEEEEEDPMRKWQSRQAAHLLAEEVEDVQTGTEEEESDEEPPPPIRRKGPQDVDEPDQQSHSEPESKVYINAETTNQYDWEFHEELDIADLELNEGGYIG